MRLKGVSIAALSAIVETVSRELYAGNLTFKREPEINGNFLQFTLTVTKSADKGGRRSNTGRKIAALCWHGHRDIMRALFAAYPNALLITAMARYDGRADFLDTYMATGRVNLGSIAAPLAARDACECREGPQRA